MPQPPRSRLIFRDSPQIMALVPSNGWYLRALAISSGLTWSRFLWGKMLVLWDCVVGAAVRRLRVTAKYETLPKRLSPQTPSPIHVLTLQHRIKKGYYPSHLFPICALSVSAQALLALFFRPPFSAQLDTWTFHGLVRGGRTFSPVILALPPSLTQNSTKGNNWLMQT